MKKRYVLISAVFNEENFIRRTIESVLAQSILPERWVIVDDGSTDNSIEIISRFLKDHKFINLIQRKKEHSRSFSSKASAINFAYQSLVENNYDYIGILDADISFDKNYYEQILEKFKKNPRLGIAGGILYELKKISYVKQKISLNSVAGAIQMFRKACYTEIGGYQEISTGIDTVAEIMARVNGWKVQAFPTIPVFHHRYESSYSLKSSFFKGLMHYSVGYHPLFLLARAINRIRLHPFLLGSLAFTSGYIWGFLRRQKKIISKESIEFLRKEQIDRLIKSALLRLKM